MPPPKDLSSGIADTYAPSGAPRSGLEFPEVDPSRYEFTGELGRGGMGRVRIARDVRLNREVAIKELLHHDRSLVDRFWNEVRITARLQHPSIVSLHDAGRWPDGTPFFAMKRISGRPLDVVLDEARTLAERLAHLPALVAAADAVAYAHAHGVVHRDLKPANVVLGDFGETVVIDWGLAKDLRDGSAQPAAPSDPQLFTAAPVATPQPAAATAAGALLGTPAYMAPEQARGESADERSDVYALGALLYHLLTGRPPHVGDDLHEVVSRARQGGVEDVLLLAPRAPPELVTMVRRSMAAARQDRFSGARAFVDELRRYQTGQLVGSHAYTRSELLGRWLRRNRAAAAVGAVALALLVAVSTFSLRRVLHAQRDAEQRRVEAESLLDFMLNDLYEKLRPLGRLDLLDGVATRADRLFHQRGVTETPEDWLRRSAALGALADIASNRGDPSGARQHAEAALALSERLLSADPSNLEHQLRVNKRRRALYDALIATGDSQTAQSVLQVTCALAEEKVARHPDSGRWRQELAFCHRETASTLSRSGRRAEAEAKLIQSVDLLRRVVRDQPRDARLEMELADSLGRLGSLRLDDSELPGSLLAFSQGLEAARSAAELEPRNTEIQNWLSVIQDQLGRTALASGEVDRARAWFEESLAVSLELARLEPDRQAWQRNLAISYAHLSRLRQRAGDLPGARVERERSLAVLERLSQRHPENLEQLRDLAAATNHLAELLAALGDLKGALAATERDVALSRRLTVADPARDDWAEELSTSLVDLGERLLRDGRAAEADTSLREAVGLRQRLLTRADGSAAAQLSLAESLRLRGDAEAALGRRDEALVTWREAKDLMGKVPAEARSAPKWAREETTLRDRLRADRKR